MRILAASQADDVALESARLKHGLLTYALAVDGLAVGANGKRSADLDGDGRLTLAEWLRYGEEHTPALYEDIRTRQRVAGLRLVRNGVIDPNNFRMHRRARPERSNSSTSLSPPRPTLSSNDAAKSAS